METTKYANAYKEVLIIINNLTQEDYNKIPKKYIEFLKNNCNEEHKFYYDVSKDFSSQNLLDDTKYILFGLFEKFGATEIQKAKIKAFKNRYNQKLEKEKIEKYNPNDLFRRNNEIEKNEQEPEEQSREIAKCSENWFRRMWNRIKAFLGKEN